MQLTVTICELYTKYRAIYGYSDQKTYAISLNTVLQPKHHDIIKILYVLYYR